MTDRPGSGFGGRLAELTARRGPLCVGIDPHPHLLAAWGLADDVVGLTRFSDLVLDALGEQVAVFKPQVAFFERHGSRGLAVLEQVVARIRAAGALSVLDAKRGDIGSTMTAYAHAWVGPDSPLAGDAVTASPYLGVGSLDPLLSLAAEQGRGVFVLALTSNPEGAQVQAACGADGRSVAQTVLDDLAERNRRAVGPGPQGSDRMGPFGAVVGATVPALVRAHRLEELTGPILVPGLGAQGATPAQLRDLFGASWPAVLPSTSRAVLAAGPSVPGLRAAASRTLADLAP